MSKLYQHLFVKTITCENKLSEYFKARNLQFFTILLMDAPRRLAIKETIILLPGKLIFERYVNNKKFLNSITFQFITI